MVTLISGPSPKKFSGNAVWLSESTATILTLIVLPLLLFSCTTDRKKIGPLCLIVYCYCLSVTLFICSFPCQGDPGPRGEPGREGTPGPNGDPVRHTQI